MKVIRLTVGPVETNCYIVYNEEGREAFALDPGDQSGLIINTIKNEGLRLTHIVLTHSHFDHVMAVSAVKKATGAAVAIHECEAELIEHPDGEVYRRLGFGELYIPPVKPDILLHDGDRLTLSGRVFTVLATPGHTKGSVCLDDGELLFTGDTLFAGGLGRTDLPGGRSSEMFASLKRLGALEGDRVVYPGHGTTTTLDGERRTNRALIAAQRMT